MKTKKLSLHDFKAIGTDELFAVKGGLKIDSSLIFGYGRGATGGEDGDGGSGGSPCGTTINAQGYEVSPLPIDVTNQVSGSSSSSSSSSWGTTLLGAALNQGWKMLTGIGGSFFSTTALNNYPDQTPRWYQCPDGNTYSY